MIAARGVLAGIASALVTAACTTGGAVAPGGIDLALSGLAPLSNGFSYEGWALIDGDPVSTGTFNVDEDGFLVDLDGEPVTETFGSDLPLDEANGFLISIEPPGDADPGPSASRLLAGTFADGTATLDVSDPEALGVDLTSATGVFVLATPSDAEVDNELSGVWFVHPDGRPGLDLPDLPEGWIYEGWAFAANVPVTTGTFTDPTSPDGFNRYTAEGQVPPLPGEDFLRNPPRGVTFPPELQRVIVSIEPVPDIGSGPFVLRPLGLDIPPDVQDHVALEMLNEAQAFPTGVATVVGLSARTEQ